MIVCLFLLLFSVNFYFFYRSFLVSGSFSSGTCLFVVCIQVLRGYFVVILACINL